MPSFLVSLLLFAGYTLAIILFTGSSIPWNETRRSFYLGSNRTGLLGSFATFCAVWISTVTLVAYPVWFNREGFVAFVGSVNAWMLAIALMPFMVRRLRVPRSLSASEWLASVYEDERLRPLAGVVVFLTSLFILVLQFQGVTSIVSYISGIPSGVVSFSLIALFVLYTTLGGYVSVMRSGVLNLLFILLGVTVPALYVVGKFGFMNALLSIGVTRPDPVFLGKFDYGSFVRPFLMMFAWGVACSVQPQFIMRLVAVRKKRDAFTILSLAPFLLGWIYLCVTLIAIACQHVFIRHANVTNLDYPTLLVSTFPYVPATLFLIAILAAAVSTANSQLLQAAASCCYDLWPFLTRTVQKKRSQDPIKEENFLFVNRLVIALILIVAMLLGRLDVPDILQVTYYSWSMVAICFLFPLLLPAVIPKQGLFECTVASLLFHVAVMALLLIPPELSLFLTLSVEYALLTACKKGWIDVKRYQK